ncbi:Protein extra-macrochaetae, partial [Orchesella cincta]
AQLDTTGNSTHAHVGGVRDGKVHKAKHHSHHHKEEENEEIKAYLNKLQEIVPFMPKNRKLSKLEVISHVIDYIRDLRQTLGLPPCNSDFDMESMMSQVVNPAITLNVINATSSSVNAPISSSSHHHHQRQPLCVISNPSNTLSSNGSCASQEERLRQ